MVPEKNSQELGIYSLLLSIILIWGISWPVAKFGLNYMPPVWYAASRLIIATVTMFIIVAATKKLNWPRRQDLKIILVIGGIQIGLFMLLVNIGLHYVNAGRAAILVYTTPLWVVPISILIFKEESTALKWIGFMAGMIGVAILFNPLSIDWSDYPVLFGNGVLLIAALCWAIAILCARHMQWTRTPFELISWQLLVGTIPVTVFAILTEPFAHIMWNPSLILSLTFIGIFATAFGYWATVVISKELPPTTTSLSLLAIPVLSVISSAFILNESITFTVILGMSFILLGLLCVVIKRRKPPLITA